MKMTFQQWVEDYGLRFEPNYSPCTLFDCGKAWQASRIATLSELREISREEADKAHRLATEEALNACISYVKNGTADFTGMPVKLVEYFKQQVDTPRSYTPDTRTQRLREFKRGGR